MNENIFWRFWKLYLIRVGFFLIVILTLLLLILLLSCYFKTGLVPDVKAAPVPIPKKGKLLKPVGIFIRSQASGVCQVTLFPNGKYNCWWFGVYYIGTWSWDAIGEVVMVEEKMFDDQGGFSRYSYQTYRKGNKFGLVGYEFHR